MDWFERIAGFPEKSYCATQSRLVVRGRHLVSTQSGRQFDMGMFSMPTLNELRAQLGSVKSPSTSLSIKTIQGDIRRLHRNPDFKGAVFQVASQFNMLEMIGPSVTPEDGVKHYQTDHTQGPACAIAAGAATIYRNYLVPVAGQVGQSVDVQLNGLEDIGCHLEKVTGQPISNLWSMQNGYPLCTASGLKTIAHYLEGLDEISYRDVCGLLRVGLHADVEVTDGDDSPGPKVTQVFCSALPVAYSRHPSALWSEFAKLILSAAYEATLTAAALKLSTGGSKHVLLTFLGGGAFGNRDAWIEDAILRAVQQFKRSGLCVWLVTLEQPSKPLSTFVAKLNADDGIL